MGRFDWVASLQSPGQRYVNEDGSHGELVPAGWYVRAIDPEADADSSTRAEIHIPFAISDQGDPCAAWLAQRIAQALTEADA